MSDKSFLAWPFFSDEHRKLSDSLEKWAKSKLCNLNHQDEYEGTKMLVRLLGEAGWLKHCVISPHGGNAPSLDVRSLCIIRETLARYGSLADFAFAMQGLGSGPISLFGTEAQKRRYLPPVSSGKAIAAFALSESEAGSDVSALKCSAERKGDHYILNGTKSWISNAGIADSYVVVARTGEAPGAKGLSAFIVNGDAPGFRISENVPITSPHPIGSLELKNCKVPTDALLGEPGEGFKIAMATLDVFRSTVGAAALGFARRALDEALSFSAQRNLFGKNLSEMQMTQAKIAEMATAIDASALLIYRAAWLKDTGTPRVTREAAMAKLYATESAQRVIDDAVQLLGGRGVIAGSVVEGLYRDIRPLRIYEGTSEIQRIIISTQTYQIFQGEK